jgi:hypothetical protein
LGTSRLVVAVTSDRALRRKAAAGGEETPLAQRRSDVEWEDPWGKPMVNWEKHEENMGVLGI